jgi:hypothetical protein
MDAVLYVIDAFFYWSGVWLWSVSAIAFCVGFLTEVWKSIKRNPRAPPSQAFSRGIRFGLLLIIVWMALAWEVYQGRLPLPFQIPRWIRR